MSDFRTESVYEYEMRIARAEVDRLLRIEEAARAVLDSRTTKAGVGEGWLLRLTPAAYDALRTALGEET